MALTVEKETQTGEESEKLLHRGGETGGAIDKAEGEVKSEGNIVALSELVGFQRERWRGGERRAVAAKK